MATDPTLLVDGALLGINAVIFGHVARVLWMRSVPQDARRANALFAAWWACLAAVLALTAGLRFLAAVGALSLPMYLAVVEASLLLFCAGVVGLLYYLRFLLTGNERLPVLIAFQAAIFAGVAYYLSWLQPARLEVAPWHVQAHFARAPGGWPLAGALVLLGGPSVIGALGYFSLFFRVRDASQRYRIALVSGAILAWAAGGLLSSDLELTSGVPAAIASRLVGIAAALTILLAYQPPDWVRRRLMPNAA